EVSRARNRRASCVRGDLRVLNNASFDELGRAVLAQLQELSVAPLPECYAVWFRYRQNVNPQLGREIEKRRNSGQPIDSDFITSLYYQFCDVADLGPVFDRYFGNILGEVEGLQNVAQSLASSAQTFGSDVKNITSNMDRKSLTELELRGFI